MSVQDCSIRLYISLVAETGSKKTRMGASPMKAVTLVMSALNFAKPPIEENVKYSRWRTPHPGQTLIMNSPPSHSCSSWARRSEGPPGSVHESSERQATYRSSTAESPPSGTPRCECASRRTSHTLAGAAPCPSCARPSTPSAPGAGRPRCGQLGIVRGRYPGRSLRCSTIPPLRSRMALQRVWRGSSSFWRCGYISSGAVHRSKLQAHTATLLMTSFWGREGA